MAKEYIRSWNGKILGSYEDDLSGRVVLRDFYGRILGRYDPKENLTRDFYGKIIGKGNQLGRLVPNEN